MRKTSIPLFIAPLLLCGANALASHLTCVNSANVPNTDLKAFNFSAQVPLSTGGGGSGVGKLTSNLTVQTSVNSSFATLYSIVSNGTHISSCVLTDVANSSTTIEFTMKNVVISQIQLISGAFFTEGTPGPLVQMVLNYDSVTTQVNP